MTALSTAADRADTDAARGGGVRGLVDDRPRTDLGAIQDGVLMIDSAGVVTLLNAAAEELLELGAITTLGRTLAELSGGELLAAVCGELALTEPRRSGAHVVEVHRSVDEALLFVRIKVRPARDAAGKVAGAVVALRDVTAEHKVDERKNRYLSIVAHELRTPLTGIKTFSSMMAKGSLGPLVPAQTSVLEAIREQVLRLEHQIDKLVHLGTLDSDEFAQDLVVFDLRELVTQSMRPFEKPAADRSIAMRADLPETPARVRADRAQLRRALQALVENAVKFSRDGGRVDVRLALVAPNRLELSVADDGVGIDPRYHARIFEKFFQVEDPLTRHHGGSGLGLFFVKSIVEAHGSVVRVDSHLGNGANFSFALPLADDRPLESEQSPGVATWSERS
ncbi:MAG: PAS domain-containing protein [Planctomycetes bacterium]|nr:PAS domain-containing protein [Planctomycetota bacterium]